jgi:hypothetical protein
MFLRFRATLEFNPGFPTFVDLLVASFVIYLCAQGAGEITNIKYIPNYKWLGILQVFCNVFGAACVGFMYELYQFRGQNPSSAAQLAMLESIGSSPN